MSNKMRRRNEDVCIECEVTVVGDNLNFDSEGNCYCPECYQAVWGSSRRRGKVILNVTPHPVTMVSQEGEVYTVEPCGTLINARPVEEPAGTHTSGAELVRTRFMTDPESEEALSRLEAENPGAVIIGSIIAAQAFPGRVLAMVPAPGFERVPPAEKRMRDDKFTTF